MPKPPAAHPLILVVGRSAQLRHLERAFQHVEGSPRALLLSAAQEALDYLRQRTTQTVREAGPLPLLLIVDDEVKGGREMLETLQQHPLLRYIVSLVLAQCEEELRLDGPSLVMPKPGKPAECERLAQRIRSLLPDRVLQ